MAKESFLLVSLKESKAKKLAQVISNESCRKILDYLSEKEATETDLAKKLDIPISTVHYNLKHLIDAGLVTAEEFHYSEKGKEVNHYKLANKYIIIAPKVFGIKEKLKSILPVALIIGLGAAALRFLPNILFPFKGMGTFAAQAPAREAFDQAIDKAVGAAQPMIAEKVAPAAEIMAEEAIRATPTVMQDTAPVLAEAGKAAIENATNITTTIPEIVETTIPDIVQQIHYIPTPSYSSIALWFLIGAVLAIILMLIADYIRKR